MGCHQSAVKTGTEGDLMTNQRKSRLQLHSTDKNEENVGGLVASSDKNASTAVSQCEKLMGEFNSRSPSWDENGMSLSQPPSSSLPSIDQIPRLASTSPTEFEAAGHSPTIHFSPMVPDEDEDEPSLSPHRCNIRYVQRSTNMRNSISVNTHNQNYIAGISKSLLLNELAHRNNTHNANPIHSLSGTDQTIEELMISKHSGPTALAGSTSTDASHPILSHGNTNTKAYDDMLQSNCGTRKRSMRTSVAVRSVNGKSLLSTGLSGNVKEQRKAMMRRV
eukprot:GILI01017316.1.p2 GENE.GILI01017316.1~~GILI01017316.1.p2  ORF type:complete len:277 (-),score=20.00 GILI01017316.1:85-915(-)